MKVRRFSEWSLKMYLLKYRYVFIARYGTVEYIRAKELLRKELSQEVNE